MDPEATESYYGGTYVTNFHNVFDESQHVTIEYNFVGGCCNTRLCIMRRMEFLSYSDNISLTGFQS